MTAIRGTGPCQRWGPPLVMITAWPGGQALEPVGGMTQTAAEPDSINTRPSPEVGPPPTRDHPRPKTARGGRKRLTERLVETLGVGPSIDQHLSAFPGANQDGRPGADVERVDVQLSVRAEQYRCAEEGGANRRRDP